MSSCPMDRNRVLDIRVKDTIAQKVHSGTVKTYSMDNIVEFEAAAAAAAMLELPG